MRHFILILNSFVFLSLFGIVQAGSNVRFDAYGWLWANKYSNAIESFSEVINQSNDAEVDDYFYRGLAYYRLGNYHNALSDFTHAAEKGKIEAQLWQARCHAHLADLNRSLNVLRSYLEDATDPKIEAIRKDSLFTGLHSSEEWFLLWQKDYGGAYQETTAAANRYIARYNYSLAHQVIDEAINTNGPNAKLHALNATIYSREDLPALAINELNYALEFEPENTDILYRKALLLMAQKQYTDAKSTLLSILEVTPYNFDARAELASVYYNLEEYPLAKDQLQLILKYSSSPELAYLACQTDYKLGNYTSVLKAINPLLEKDQSEPGYFKLRGQTYYKTHLYKQAAYDLSMSLDLDPFDADVNYTLGLTQKALNDASMACYYMQKAANLGHYEAQQYISNACNNTKNPADKAIKKGTF